MATVLRAAVATSAKTPTITSSGRTVFVIERGSIRSVLLAVARPNAPDFVPQVYINYSAGGLEVSAVGCNLGRWFEVDSRMIRTFPWETRA